MNKNNYIFYAIIIYTIIIGLLIIIKPNIIYDHNKKKFKKFGYTNDKSMFPISILSIVIAIIITLLFSFITCSDNDNINSQKTVNSVNPNMMGINYPNMSGGGYHNMSGITYPNMIIPYSTHPQNQSYYPQMQTIKTTVESGQLPQNIMYQQIPVQQIPIQQIPVQQIPVQQIPIQQISTQTPQNGQITKSTSVQQNE